MELFKYRVLGIRILRKFDSIVYHHHHHNAPYRQMGWCFNDVDFECYQSGKSRNQLQIIFVMAFQLNQGCRQISAENSTLKMAGNCKRSSSSRAHYLPISIGSFSRKWSKTMIFTLIIATLRFYEIILMIYWLFLACAKKCWLFLGWMVNKEKKNKHCHHAINQASLKDNIELTVSHN